MADYQTTTAKTHVDLYTKINITLSMEAELNATRADLNATQAELKIAKDTIKKFNASLFEFKAMIEDKMDDFDERLQERQRKRAAAGKESNSPAAGNGAGGDASEIPGGDASEIPGDSNFGDDGTPSGASMSSGAVAAVVLALIMLAAGGGGLWWRHHRKQQNASVLRDIAGQEHRRNTAPRRRARQAPATGDLAESEGSSTAATTAGSTAPRRRAIQAPAPVVLAETEGSSTAAAAAAGTADQDDAGYTQPAEHYRLTTTLARQGAAIVYAVPIDDVDSGVLQAVATGPDSGGVYVDDGFYAQGAAASPAISNSASEVYVEDGSALQPVYATPIDTRAGEVGETAI